VPTTPTPSDRRQRRLAQSQADRQRGQGKGPRGRRLGRTGRRRATWGLGGLVAAALVVVIVVVATRSTPSPAPPGAHLGVATLLRTPAASAVAQGDGAGWVTDDLKSLLIRFDPATGRTRGSVHLSGRPVAVVLDGGDAWVANMVSNTVQEISTTTLRVRRTIAVPAGPSGLAVLDGHIWVASLTAAVVSPLDPRLGVLGPPVPVPAGAVRLAAGFGSLWVTGTTDALTEITPAPGGGAPTLRSVTVGNGPIGVATGASSVWVANAAGGTVVQVNPQTRRMTHTYATGGDPLSLAVAGGRVFVGDGMADRVRTLFPAPTLGPITLVGSPRALLGVGTGVWVAAANPGRVLAVSVAGGS
jgi:YVTN family beta-propeller protein